MRYSKTQITSRVHKIPELRFEDQGLTSFAGLVIIQSLFAKLELKSRLRECSAHMPGNTAFGHHVIVLGLIVHLMLGYRRFQDMDYYRDDLMVLRLLGLKKLPDVSTVSRALATMDAAGIVKLRQLCREMLLTRLQALKLARLTMDFDGSVISTGRVAEGTAVGFNKKNKGQRSYYPLFCTIAQTAQVLDVLPRAGNVHDSNGAMQFILDCIRSIRAACPGIKIEVRMDSALFSDQIVLALDEQGVEFTISVPFERFSELKKMIDGRRRWRYFNGELSFFDTNWKPKKWDDKFRFLFIRKRVKQQSKEAVQLDLFVPQQYGLEFKVIVTNKQTTMKKVLYFNNGRGSQENTIGELKSQCNMDYVAVRRLHGNHLYLMSAVLTHNILRELHMLVHARNRGTTEKRAALWEFTEPNTLRRSLLQRAGRITHPAGTLTLTLSANPIVRNGILHYLERLKHAA
jgi:hypothetical protein